MLSQFKTFISEHNLIEPQDKILVAVSAGIDSMVLLHLFQLYAKNSFAVAHCNFNLRGKESDKDESFITEYCNKQNIQIFTIRFDTKSYAKKNGISTQMAARDLRYAWFQKIAKENFFSKIALAQHLDDQVETFFINLIRGTGLAGIHGILPIKGNLIRPLMFTNRNAINDFQISNSIPYREDLSNNSDEYLRNAIRHHIFPKFVELSPHFSYKLNDNIQHFREVEYFYKSVIQNNLNKIQSSNNKYLTLDINKLLQLEASKLHLKEFLLEKGFTMDSINKVYQNIKKPISGKRFFSKDFELLIDRSKIFIRRRNKNNNETYLLYKGENIIDPIAMNFETILNDIDHYKTPSHTALFDLDKLEFPLVLRHWKESDYFFPLNMKGKKKLSDYFINNKFSNFEKEECWILQSGKDIIWIVGHRTDNRYKVTKKTKHIYKINIDNGTN